MLEFSKPWQFLLLHPQRVIGVVGMLGILHGYWYPNFGRHGISVFLHLYSHPLWSFVPGWYTLMAATEDGGWQSRRGVASEGLSQACD